MVQSNGMENKNSFTLLLQLERHIKHRPDWERENGRGMALFWEFSGWKKSIKEKMKAVTNPLQFFLLFHNKC